MDTATLDAAKEVKPTSDRRAFGKSVAVIFIALLLSVIAVVPYFYLAAPDEEQGQTRWSMRILDTHDIFLHYEQMKSFYTGLQAREIYPRWEVETNRGCRGCVRTCRESPGREK